MPFPATRLQAAGLHAIATAAVIAAVCVLFVGVWYPAPLLVAGGGSRLLALLATVLVVTGPLLTLLLYRPGKRGLRFDMWVVGALQLGTLAAGLAVATPARPAYIAVLPMRATLVRANELHLVPHPGPSYTGAPWRGPQVVAVIDPPTAALRSALMEDILAGRPDIDYRPAYYRALATRIDDLLKHAEPMQAHLAARPALARQAGRWLEARGHRGPGALRVYPLIAPDGELTLVLDPRTRQVVGIAPWP